MSPDELKAKAAALAELYAEVAKGAMLRYFHDGRWCKCSNGPGLQSDLSLYRSEREPRREWVCGGHHGDIGRTDDPDLARHWKKAGFAVTEWQEVLP